MQEFFPREVTSRVPRITLTGRERLLVEQHRGLTICQPEQIGLRTAIGQMTVTGSGLHLIRYCAADALIGGRIDGISLESDGRRV